MTPLVYTMPRAEGPHKLMTFQHGCPHHCISPGGMYFLNTSIKDARKSVVIPRVRQHRRDTPLCYVRYVTYEVLVFACQIKNALN